MNVHPAAIVSEKANLHESVTVGPFAVVEEGVSVAAGTSIAAHALISGPTTIGENNVSDSFVALGGAPQDLTYKGEPTKLIIGDNNQIREYVSIHRGTVHGNGETILGSNNLLMAYTHVGHDCHLGNNVITVNAATIGGHVTVGDFATVGGLTGVHQFCRIGKFAFIGGASGVGLDVPPFAMVTGMRGRMRISGINKVGMRRNGFDRDSIKQVDAAYRILFRDPELLLQDAITKVEAEVDNCQAVKELLYFLKTSKRGVVRRTKGERGQ